MTNVIRLGSGADLPALAALEAEADTAIWLGETGVAWHARALADPAVEHIISTGRAAELAGFAVLAGLSAPSIELRRIVISPARRGRGEGRSLVLAAMTRAYEHHGARQVWLDVKKGNVRARTLYESLGFAEDPARAAGGLVVMVHHMGVTTTGLGRNARSLSASGQRAGCATGTL